MRSISLTYPDIFTFKESDGPYVWRDSDFASGQLSHGGDVDQLEVVLRRAFELGLKRDRAWDVVLLSAPLRERVIRAAAIYKRGVRVHGCTPPAVTRCDTLIIHHKQVADCFAGARNDDLVLVDETVHKTWWHKIPGRIVRFPFAEDDKTLRAAYSVKDLINHESPLNGRVFVVGGGVAGDIAGFASVLAAREFEFVPTTLLSLVDSSVGGKTGVNFGRWGKNQVGMFALPRATHICPEWLETLAPREINSGLAEFAKHALLSGHRGLWAAARECARLSREQRSVTALVDATIMDAIQVKSDIVSRDPFESGERRTLNFGHTVGHGLEALAIKRRQRVTHGECVAIGMFHALRLSEKYLGFAAGRYSEELLGLGIIPDRSQLVRIWGNVETFAACQHELIEIISQDKKATGDGQIPFALLSDFGRPYKGPESSWLYTVDAAEAWNEILATWKILAG